MTTRRKKKSRRRSFDDGSLSSLTNFVDKANARVVGRSPSVLPFAEDILRQPVPIFVFANPTQPDSQSRTELCPSQSETIESEFGARVCQNNIGASGKPTSGQQQISDLSVWFEAMVVGGIILFLVLLLKLIVGYKTEPQTFSSPGTTMPTMDSSFDREFETKLYERRGNYSHTVNLQRKALTPPQKNDSIHDLFDLTAERAGAK